MKLQLESNLVRHILKNVYFINGTAYAGKSTMVHLLAEKYNGIECGENYHDALRDAIDAQHQPHLSYFDTMSGWQEFIHRTPEEYDAWITGSSQEAAELELILLLHLAQQDKKIFVDTNIPTKILKEISDYHHVAIMLSPQSMSVNRFFDREDADKQFLYRQIMLSDDPEATMANYRKCLEKINSRERYDEFAQSGFFTHIRTEESTIPDTLAQLEQHFQLNGKI